MNYFSQFEQKTLDKFIPYQGILELTYRCNLECIHCYIDRSAGHGGARPFGTKPMPELSTQEWMHTLDQLAEAGCLTLTMLGGEVFARPDFFELAEYAVSKHFVLRLITNATLINDNISQRLQALGVFNIDVSLYGTSNKTYQAVTGYANGWDRVQRGIESLLKYQQRVIIKVPLMKSNFDDLTAMADFANRYQLPVQFDPFLTPRTDSGDMEPTRQRLSAEQLQQFHRWQQRPVVKTSRKADDVVCISGRNAVTISPFGDVFPCGQIKLPAGNLRQQSFKDVWQDSPILKRMRAFRFGDMENAQDINPHEVICPGKNLLECGSLGCQSGYAKEIAHSRSKANEAGSNNDNSHMSAGLYDSQ